MVTEFNNLIMRQAAKLKYRVADKAPNTASELFNGSPTLVVWSGQSESTIYGDARVNWAFRALHDALHLVTGLGFSPAEEIELGRIQASQCSSSLLADLVYIETAGQAEYYMQTGQFVQNQIEFTINQLKQRGIK